MLETIKYYGLQLGLKPADRFLEFLGHYYSIFRWFVAVTPAPLLNKWSKLRALRVYLYAKRNVPAYRIFTSSQNGGGFHVAPETDKESYIKPYQTELRCRNGGIPAIDTVVDESSGSTGVAYNWVRSLEERKVSHAFISMFSRYCIPQEKLFTLNAFSMGSWATGLNIGLSLQKNGLVKNIGPDIDKILDTLRFWGTRYNYLICGYPPFLKYLIDTARERNFPLESYTLYAFVGGEGMSEGLRDYLLQRFKKVYSGYGATDLEIGIAGETPLSVAIRRVARENEKLRDTIFGPDSRLPMLFQYNPLMHYVEVTPNRELVFTITRLNVLSPRIRYNIHDEGGIMPFKRMMELCRRNVPDIEAMLTDGELKCIPRLPFLWIYGRSDSTVSIMGANIYPEDIEQSVYAEPELACVTKSFCLELHEDGGEARPMFSFEVAGEVTEELRAKFQEAIPRQLATFNRDFREAMREHPKTLIPIINLCRLGEGIFAQDKGRIKQRRIAT